MRRCPSQLSHRCALSGLGSESWNLTVSLLEGFCGETSKNLFSPLSRLQIQGMGLQPLGHPVSHPSDWHLRPLASPLLGVLTRQRGERSSDTFATWLSAIAKKNEEKRDRSSGPGLLSPGANYRLPEPPGHAPYVPCPPGRPRTDCPPGQGCRTASLGICTGAFILGAGTPGLLSVSWDPCSVPEPLTDPFQ